MKQTRSLSEFSCLSEFTRLYPISSLPAEHRLYLHEEATVQKAIQREHENAGRKSLSDLEIPNLKGGKLASRRCYSGLHTVRQNNHTRYGTEHTTSWAQKGLYMYKLNMSSNN